MPMTPSCGPASTLERTIAGCAPGSCTMRTAPARTCSARRPTPEPGPGEVRVALRASALNHLDLWVARGMPAPPSFPHVSGADGAGVVDAIGDEVDDLRIGDEVVIDPSTSCGACSACAHGDVPFCPRLPHRGRTSMGHARRRGGRAGRERALEARLALVGSGGRCRARDLVGAADAASRSVRARRRRPRRGHRRGHLDGRVPLGSGARSAPAVGDLAGRREAPMGGGPRSDRWLPHRRSDSTSSSEPTPTAGASTSSSTTSARSRSTARCDRSRGADGSSRTARRRAARPSSTFRRCSGASSR